MRKYLTDVLERAAIFEFDQKRTRGEADRLAWLAVMGEEMSYPVNTVLFACSATDEAAEAEARKYITDNGFTRDDVKLCRTESCTLVIAKREVM